MAVAGNALRVRLLPDTKSVTLFGLALAGAEGDHDVGRGAPLTEATVRRTRDDV